MIRDLQNIDRTMFTDGKRDFRWRNKKMYEKDRRKKKFSRERSDNVSTFFNKNLTTTAANLHAMVWLSR